MTDRLLNYIKSHKKQLEDQAVYLRDTNWANISNRKLRTEEHKVQLTILKSILNKLKYIAKEAGEELSTNQTVKKFAKNLIKQLEVYIDRSNVYMSTELWQTYDNVDDKQEEILFQDSILTNIISFNDVIDVLNIEKTTANVILSLHSNKMVSFAMRATVERKFPDIVNILKNKKYVS